MGLQERLLKRRLVAIFLILVIALCCVWEWRGSLRWVGDERYARVGDSSLEQDLKSAADISASIKLRKLHKLVKQEISAARGRRFDADHFERLADSALELDKPAYRSAAMERLQKLRLAIPSRSETLRPASKDDLGIEDDAPAPRGIKR